jgi:hypothetical protein
MESANKPLVIRVIDRLDFMQLSCVRWSREQCSKGDAGALQILPNTNQFLASTPTLMVIKDGRSH